LAGHGRVVAAFASMGRWVSWVHRPTQPGWPVTLAANWPTQFGSATTRRREKTTPGLHPGSRCDGRVPEVDDDQPAALRGCGSPLASSRSSRSSAITQSLAMTQRMIRVGHRGAWRKARMTDPRRMTPEEHGEAHALLVRAVTDPDWQAASQALDDLTGKLAVLHRLLEAEERLPQRTPRRNG
jgi:hypothetical protein